MIRPFAICALFGATIIATSNPATAVMTTTATHRHERLHNHVARVLAHAEAEAPTAGSTTHFFDDAVLDHYQYRFGSLSGGSNALRWSQRFYARRIEHACARRGAAFSRCVACRRPPAGAHSRNIVLRCLCTTSGQ